MDKSLIKGIPKGVVFDPETHHYTYNGVVGPSVTGLLNTWVKSKSGQYYYNSVFKTWVWAETFEEAGRFGTAVHQYCKELLSGNDITIDRPDFIPPVEQFIKWHNEHLREVFVAEEPMYSVQGFFGTLDIFGLDKKGELVLVDIKTGDYSLAGPQLSGYEMLVRENILNNKKHRIKRYVLSLPKEAGKSYKFIEMINDRDDKLHFQACLSKRAWEQKYIK